MSPWALMRLASALCMRLVRPACRVLVGGGKGPPVCLDGNAKRCVCARHPWCAVLAHASWMQRGGGGLVAKHGVGPTARRCKMDGFGHVVPIAPAGPQPCQAVRSAPHRHTLSELPGRPSLLPAERLHAPVPPRGSQLGGFPMLPRYALPGGAYTKLVWELGPTWAW
jgi:hypothetical protein